MFRCPASSNFSAYSFVRFNFELVSLQRVYYSRVFRRRHIRSTCSSFGGSHVDPGRQSGVVSSRPHADNASRWSLVFLNMKVFMSDRRKLITVFGVLLVLGVVVITSVWLNKSRLSPDGISIQIVIENRTNKQIGPFVISEHGGSAPLRIGTIQPSSAVNVYYQRPMYWGENAITMRDDNDNEYAVVPYFEGSQSGRVDIRVECATPEGLSGKKRDLVSWYFSLEWNSWGTSACE
jgi:hypothetical protein